MNKTPMVMTVFGFPFQLPSDIDERTYRVILEEMIILNTQVLRRELAKLPVWDVQTRFEVCQHYGPHVLADDVKLIDPVPEKPTRTKIRYWFDPGKGRLPTDLN